MNKLTEVAEHNAATAEDKAARAVLARELEIALEEVRESITAAVRNELWDTEFRIAVVATLHEISDNIIYQGEFGSPAAIKIREESYYGTKSGQSG